MISVLTFYLSFRPFIGWRIPQAGPFAWVGQPIFPIDVTWDLIENLFWYILVGFLAALSVLPRVRRSSALFVGFIGPLLFSMLAETVQAYLPGRTSQMSDVLSNGTGALIGATIAVLTAHAFLLGGGLAGLRIRWFVAGPTGSIGLVFLGIWFLTLLAPRTLLFVNGDWRVDLGVQAGIAHSSMTYTAVEAALTAGNLLSLTCLFRVITGASAPRRRLILALILSSLIVRTSAFGLFWTTRAAFGWATDGALLGLALGVGLSILLINVRQQIAMRLACLLLTSTLIGVNFVPPDPGTWMKPRPTRQSELEPVSRLARLTAASWPLGVLTFLAWVYETRRRARHEDHIC
jgi:VanZ family protein